jgi:hypothetical protein
LLDAKENFADSPGRGVVLYDDGQFRDRVSFVRRRLAFLRRPIQRLGRRSHRQLGEQHVVRRLRQFLRQLQ